MRFNSLDDWLTWQEGLHPVEIDLGLDRVDAVRNNLGLDKSPCTVITVAGTNGKGSCVAMLDTISRAAGYHVGTYTSPHFLRYNERISINGFEIEDAALCNAFEQVDQARGKISLSYFEFGTLAALLVFQQANLDVVILEVGLGGRLDAVNIMDADLALISTVDIDHTEWLGNSREQIGSEKAGIFRAGKPAIYGNINPPESVRQVAKKTGASLYCLGEDYSYTVEPNGWIWRDGAHCRSGLPLPALQGEVQVQNAASVLMAFELMVDRLPVNADEIRNGLLGVKLKGRFQVLPGKIPQILDVAHNPDAARVLHKNLQKHGSNGRTHAVIAMLSDKDVEGVVSILLDDVDVWYVAGLSVARGLNSRELADRIRAVDVSRQVIECADVKQAIRKALQDGNEGGRLLIFGSFYTVAEALQNQKQ